MTANARSPYRALRENPAFDEIDGILDEIGLPKEADKLEKRLLFLYDILGVKRVFSGTPLTLEEKYIFAKEELSAKSWPQISKNKALTQVNEV
jgi:hypothetical protein